MIELSDEYKYKIKKMFGEVGVNWLKTVPDKIEIYIEKFDLKNINIIKDLTYNVLLFAENDIFGQVVLKLEIPFKELTMRESRALVLNKGNGACKCFYSNIDDGILLLERLQPGFSLNSISNLEDRMKIFFDVSNKFNIKCNDGILPSYRSILNRTIEISQRDNRFNNIKKYIYLSDKLYREIENEKLEKYLLHSDLHGNNILKSGNDWKAIDPHGFIGEKIIDSAIYIQNELEKYNFNLTQIDEILSLFSFYTKFTKESLGKILFINYILNLCWDIEVNLDISKALENANNIYDYYKTSYKVKKYNKILELK